MAKVQVKRQSTHIDMTAMCDVAFLLLTFFMLATSFKPVEPVATINPTSVSEIVLDDKDVMLITIGPKGNVFFSIDNPKNRMQLIENINESMSLGLDEAQKTTFANGASIGLPFNQLGQFLRLEPKDQSGFQQEGIPIDTSDYTKNQLTEWINAARYANPALRIAIKADKKTPYTSVDAVIMTFEQMKIHKFNLVTNLEAVPEGTALWKEITSGKKDEAAAGQ